MRGVAQTCFFRSAVLLERGKAKCESETKRTSQPQRVFIFALCLLHFALFFPKSRRPKKQVCATSWHELTA